MNWIDMLFIVVLLLSSMIGYKRGFILTLFSLGSYVIAFFFTRLYYTDLSLWLQSRDFLSDRIRGLVGSTFNFNVPTVAGITEEINIKLPVFLQQHLVNKIDLEVYAEEAVEAVSYHIEGIITTFVINIISIVVLFLIIRAIILVIGYLVNGVFKLPVLSTFNGVGGAALGMLKGTMIVVIILLMMIPIAITSSEGIVANGLEKSATLPLFSNYLLPYILSWL